MLLARGFWAVFDRGGFFFLISSHDVWTTYPTYFAILNYILSLYNSVEDQHNNIMKSTVAYF